MRDIYVHAPNRYKFSSRRYGEKPLPLRKWLARALFIVAVGIMAAQIWATLTTRAASTVANASGCAPSCNQPTLIPPTATVPPPTATNTSAPSASPTKTQPPPTASPAPSLRNQIMDALEAGLIQTAIDLIGTIKDPAPADVGLLSLRVRLMLDHLYTIDATDFEMPSLKRRIDEALATADLAIHANPNAQDGWVIKALALDEAYRSEEALLLIQHARDIDSNSPVAMAIAAQIYASLARYADANKLIDAVIPLAQASSPLNRRALARAYYVKGNIEQILGHADESIRAYESAWAISAMKYDRSDPWDVVPPGYIIYQLGPIYLFKGKAALALQRYAESMNIDKEDPFLYYLRGRAYRYLGDPADAETEFAKCTAMDSQQTRCLRNLGQIAYDGQNWAGAIRYFQPIIAENSQISDDYYYLASAFTHAGLCDRATPLISRGVSLEAASSGKPHWRSADYTELVKGCKG